MIAEAVVVDGNFLMSGATLIAIVVAAWQISKVVTRFTVGQEKLGSDIKEARDKIVALETEHRNHRHEDNTKHHALDKRLDRVEHALESLGVPNMIIRNDVTPIVSEPLPSWRTQTPRVRTDSYTSIRRNNEEGEE